MDDLYKPLKKYSVTLSGHRTSITLEPAFWSILKEIAHHKNLNMSVFLGDIDRERMQMASEFNLSSVLRLKVLEYLLDHYPSEAIHGKNSSKV